MRTSSLLVLVLLGSCVVQPASRPSQPPQHGGGYQSAPGAPPTASGPMGVSCGGGNLALGKPARQSSQSSWSKPNDASGAVDGTKTGGFGFHTAEEPNPWWEVDLGQLCAIGQIVIYNRLDCCGERAAKLQIAVSSGQGDWQVIYTHNGAAFGGKDGGPLVVDGGGRAARLVRVQLATTAYLHLDEVEIFGAGSQVAGGAPPATSPPPPVASPAVPASCGSGNIALGKPARQSSQSQWSAPSNDAQGGVDGKKTGGFGFHTASEAQPWWEVDLGRVCPLRTLRIYNRLDCCSDRAATLQVLVSTGGGSWQVAYRHNGSGFGGHDGKPLVVDLGGRAGQVVRVQLTGSEYLHFDEIEIESR